MNRDDHSNINDHNEKDISIKIRSIDKEFLVEMNTQDSIECLKQKIENISKVPSARQRLIFRGKLLQDNDTLSYHKITNLDVIHLVAKIGETNSEENAMTIDSNNNSSRESRRDSAILGIMNRIFRADIPISAQGTSSESTAQSNATPSSSSLSGVLPSLYGRRVRRTSREEGAHSANSEFNSIECRETISQNLATIDNLIQCKEFEGNSNLNLNEKFNLFDFSKRRLVKGQWVDVKDTIDQWLEAQVIDLMGDKVYIHYNGWGTRWDEWIDMGSARIMPFRYHTRQTTVTNFQSPFPNVRPDANVNLFGREPRSSLSCNINNNNNISSSSSSSRSNDFLDVLEEVQKVMKITSSLIEEINETRNPQSEKECNANVCIQNISTDRENNNTTIKNRRQRNVYSSFKKLLPFLDRLGRLITDTGTYINYDLRNNKMDDLDYSLFNSNECNLDPIFKPLSHDIQNEQNEDRPSTSAGSSRNVNARIIPTANRMDQLISNQVPLMDTPLNIIYRGGTQAQPVIDIYVHTFVSPVSGERGTGSQREGSNSTTIDSNERTVPNIINNLMSSVIGGGDQGSSSSGSANPGTSDLTISSTNNNIHSITPDNEGTVDNENKQHNYIGRKRAKDNTEAQGGDPHNFKRVRTDSNDEEEISGFRENMHGLQDDQQSSNDIGSNNKNANQKERENATTKMNEEYKPHEPHDHKPGD